MSLDSFILYEPRFVEESVFLALRGRPEARLFHREQSGLYEMADAEEREGSFVELNRRWFIRLGLAPPIEQAVAEQPLLLARTDRCWILSAPGKTDKGAELFVKREEEGSDRDRRSIRILLKPESLLDASALLTFLRHELYHVADMLDPRFAYEPSLPAGAGGPAHDMLLRDRYRALWDATIDGRMARRGWLSPSARADDLQNFTRAFPIFGAEAEGVFSNFFDREPHTHPELLAFACAPRLAAENPSCGARADSCCPLCRFPTHAFELHAEELPEDALAAIGLDFPGWEPSQGLCIQCADLYRARRLSAAAALRLPGSCCNSSHR